MSHDESNPEPKLQSLGPGGAQHAGYTTRPTATKPQRSSASSAVYLILTAEDAED